MLLVGTAEAAPGRSSAGGVPAAVSELEARVEVLAATLDALGPRTVAVDCDADGPGALQAAVDATTPAGADITLSGQCGATIVSGKRNLRLTGGFIGDGNGVRGLHIEASTNVSLGDLTVLDSGDQSPLEVSGGSTVYLDGDLSVAGGATFRMTSTLQQRAGALTIAGELSVNTGSQVEISEGTLGGFGLTRAASLLLVPMAPGQTVEVNGGMGVFSGSNFVAQATAPNAVRLLDPGGTFFVQRNAAAVFGNSGVELDVEGIWVRQNGVLDVLFLSETKVQVANAGLTRLTQGGGARIFFSDATGPFLFQCDDSAWVDVFAQCAP